MVLESLIGEAQATRKPQLMLFLGFVFSCVSMLVVYFFFRESASFLAIAFITIASAPIVHAIFIREEEREARAPIMSETFLERNMELISVYAFFTLGVILGYAFMYVLTPAEPIKLCVGKACTMLPTRAELFAEQEETLAYISKIAQGTTGKFVANEQANMGEFFYWFDIILTNNASVLTVAVLFSFLFGAGAIFLISWNASIVGVWIGKSILASNHFKFFGLIPHGIPEFVGYFLGAIAGGLISTALSKKRHFTHEIERIATDSFLLLVAAFISLVFGAAIEAGFKSGMNSLALTLSVLYIVALSIAIVKVK